MIEHTCTDETRRTPGATFERDRGDCWACFRDGPPAGVKLLPAAAGLALFAGRHGLNVETPCAHEGAVIEPCQRCGNNEGRHVRDCDLHERCTRTFVSNRVKSCDRCPDYQPEGGQTVTTRHLLYHVYPRKDSAWRSAILRLRESIELFNGKRIVAVAHDGTTESPVMVADALAGAGCEVISVRNNANLREVATFEPLFSRVADLRGPGDVTLYAHAKGVTRPTGSTCHRWAEVLAELMFGYWPVVDALLATHPVVGAFKKNGRGWHDHESKSTWHYSGSWYWFRNAALFSKPDWRRIDQNWTGIEPYPSLHFTADQAASVFLERPVGEMNLYAHEMWRTVEPALAAWKEANAGRRTVRPGLTTPPRRQLNLGCGPHHAPGWWNVDVIHTDVIQPDQVIEPGRTLPWADGAFDRAYLGHMLEHVPWAEVPALLAEVCRVVKLGGSVCVVGPDVKVALEKLHAAADRQGALSHVWEVIEDAAHYQRESQEREWPGARHHWNCYGERVEWVMRNSSFGDVAALPLASLKASPDAWPLVDDSNTSQCAVVGRVTI